MQSPFKGSVTPPIEWNFSTALKQFWPTKAIISLIVRHTYLTGIKLGFDHRVICVCVSNLPRIIMWSTMARSWTYNCLYCKSHVLTIKSSHTKPLLACRQLMICLLLVFICTSAVIISAHKCHTTSLFIPHNKWQCFIILKLTALLGPPQGTEYDQARSVQSALSCEPVMTLQASQTTNSINWITHFSSYIWSPTAPAPSDSVFRALCTNWLTYLLTYHHHHQQQLHVAGNDYSTAPIPWLQEIACVHILRQVFTKLVHPSVSRMSRPTFIIIIIWCYHEVNAEAIYMINALRW